MISQWTSENFVPEQGGRTRGPRAGEHETVLRYASSMDLSSPAPIVHVGGYDHVIAEWTADPALLTVGVVVFVIMVIVMAAVLWGHL
jgi:hypothetical protein